MKQKQKYKQIPNKTKQKKVVCLLKMRKISKLHHRWMIVDLEILFFIIYGTSAFFVSFNA